MNTRIDRVYWISTGLFAAIMLLAGIQDLRHAPALLESALRLGYPPYLLSILGVAKLVGAPLLLIPLFPRLREWVYAGFAFNLGGAIASHTVVGDTWLQTLPAIFCAALWALSYGSYRMRPAAIATRDAVDAGSQKRRPF